MCIHGTCVYICRIVSRVACAGARTTPVCMVVYVHRYLHKEHAFYDLDDEVEELNEMISDRQFTKADVHQASSGSHSVRPAGGLGQGEYDY